MTPAGVTNCASSSLGSPMTAKSRSCLNKRLAVDKNVSPSVSAFRTTDSRPCRVSRSEVEMKKNTNEQKKLSERHCNLSFPVTRTGTGSRHGPVNFSRTGSRSVLSLSQLVARSSLLPDFGGHVNSLHKMEEGRWGVSA